MAKVVLVYLLTDSRCELFGLCNLILLYMKALNNYEGLAGRIKV